MTNGETRTIRSGSEAQTIALGRAIARALKPGDVVALSGELGAGKTRLVRGIAEGLGIPGEQAHSPTYVLANVYDAPSGVRLVHIDAYRLSGASELEELGWDRLNDGHAIVVIEWADRLSGALDSVSSVLSIHVAHAGPSERVLAVTAPPGRELPLPIEEAARAEADSAPVCRTCGATYAAGAESAPFCSARCRMADLGKWFGGEFKISRELNEADLDSE